jgi:hypothetical protein
MRQQGFDEEVAVLEVRNVGRLAVSVERIGLDSNDGWGFEQPGDPANADLPHRLEPGAMQAWHLPLIGLQALVDSDGKPRQAHMTVELGTGKTIRTSDHIDIAPTSPAAKRS